MHLVAAHAEYHIPTLVQFLKRNTLGLLITNITSSKEAALQASHIPWVIDENPDPEQLPKLRGHIARMNPQVKSIVEQTSTQPPIHEGSTAKTLKDEVLIMFNGPVHGYVSPKFYIETKPSTGKVVPTWDYTSVQAYGVATVYHDSKSSETISFLRNQLDALTSHSEKDVEGDAWKIDDAPESYVELLMKNIIGIEIEVTRLEGRMKMSQDKSFKDRVGVAEGFEGMGTEAGRILAGEVRIYAEVFDEKKKVRRQQRVDAQG
ncbi:Uncharacterized protein HII31_04861 [Pseudocercospora fuligena]|uniref:Transcriptional regulator n=1 Tax=Pseudocercospora fuligena TaxID=685502 RepID=A0A8H6RNA4_9PEZI|nr:Uncharacterized protein HII31_04861 [Pseudocercospora fuligena]